MSVKAGWLVAGMVGIVLHRVTTVGSSKMACEPGAGESGQIQFPQYRVLGGHLAQLFLGICVVPFTVEPA